MLDIVSETIIDSLKVLPFLLLSYLLIEYIEHKSSQKLEKALSTSGKYSTIVGGILGIIPQCGFSTVAANLFSSRVITVGTLVTVFLATSDEAIPLLIGEPGMRKELMLILAIKFAIAVIAGSTIDFVTRKIKKTKANSKKNEEERHEHIHHMCEEDHCDCEHGGILKPAIKHTLQIFTFLLVATFLITLAVDLIGEERFSSIILSGSLLQPFVASLIGLIPNCAASVLLSKLYISGSLSLGSIIAGLSTGAGVGGIVLFKTNKNVKENAYIVGLVYLIGVFSGIIIDCIMRLI